MLPLLLIAACDPPSPGEPVLLVVGAADPALLAHGSEIEEKLHAAAEGRLTLIAREIAARTIAAEGGQAERQSALVTARVLIRRAEEQFRDLDDEAALDGIARATASLASIHQEEGAVELLAHAHLLAGAIFLARDRLPAAKQRLQRALDLHPDIEPDPHQLAPRVLTELAALRAAEPSRPTGSLEVSGAPGASVYVDGRLRGTTPLVLDAVGEGRHLLRVSAPGYQSYISSISIDAARRHVERVHLTVDQEARRIGALSSEVQRGRDPSPTLALLATRAEAARAILASLVLSDARTATGRAAVGVELFVPGAGRSFAPTADPEALRAALDRALACDPNGPAPSRFAPASLGFADVGAVRPSPVPEPATWWNQPWFWGVAAAAVLAVAGGLVVARAAQGPPEVVEVTLIPRP